MPKRAAAFIWGQVVERPRQGSHAHWIALATGTMRRDEALLELLLHLKELGYFFTAVTPATHGRVLCRNSDAPPTLRDIFGWSRPFEESQLDPRMRELMGAANLLRRGSDGLRSGLRVASLGDDLFYHSAYPTADANAVFFGPDTYRFVQFIERRLPELARGRVADMGAGTGAGGLVVKRLAPSASITLVDTNAAALDLAGVNARACGRDVELLHGDSLPPWQDLVIANPPYMMDEGKRCYRDGGDLLGGEVALEWTCDALAKLAPSGTMLLYTGVAIIEGASPLVNEIAEVCRRAGASMTCEEIDPDVFGEELEKPAYGSVERIAAVGIVRPRPRLTDAVPPLPTGRARLGRAPEPKVGPAQELKYMSYSTALGVVSQRLTSSHFNSA